MKLKNILPACLAALTLTACDDSYNDQFDFLKENTVTDVLKGETVQLTGDDIATIIKLARENGLADSASLARLAANKAFVDEAQAAELLPPLLKARYLTADEGSVVNVQFDVERARSKYLAQLDSAIVGYQLSADDYAEVWKDSITKATYLTPSTRKQIPARLKAAMPEAQEGHLCAVEYLYNAVEPSTGGGSSDDKPVIGEWQEVTIPEWPTGTDWNFVCSGDIDLSAYAGMEVQVAFEYNSDGTGDNTATWEVKNLVFYDENGDEMLEKRDSLTSQESFDLFTVEGEVPEGLNFVWSFGGNKYGAKASAYVSGTRYAVSSKFVSPWVKIGDDCTFDFEHTYRYCNEASTYLKVYVRTKSTAKKGTRAASAAEAALYRFDGSAWSEYKTDDANVQVVAPATYGMTAAGYFNDADNQLPIYLANNFAYAAEGDIVCLIYKSGTSKYALKEYELKEGAWSAVGGSVKAELPFTLKDGAWSADLSTYFHSSLLGESGGMEAINTMLSEGVTYVWSNTSAYGWKGTSYVNKTNMPSVSYLLTPTIKLKNAKAPVLNFMEAINYMNGKPAGELLRVCLTTSYTGDPTTTEWVDITPEDGVRAAGNNWTFVTIPDIDLTAYANESIVIAFRYESTSDTAPTWEIKELSVMEKAEGNVE